MKLALFKSSLLNCSSSLILHNSLILSIFLIFKKISLKIKFIVLYGKVEVNGFMALQNKNCSPVK